jgi:endonuclease/exonuclease/phosphatase (EEP) superfamily protein YafD
MLTTGKIILFILGYFLIIISLIPLIRSDNWMFRIFEYPRFQKLVINILLLAGFVFLFDADQSHDIVFLALLSANALYLIYQIWPYTFIATRQMKRIKHYHQADAVSLLICNVYQDNRSLQSLLQQISKNDPDMILLVEIDAWWKKGLEVLHNNYPHRVLKPLENTYGMCLYSKFELINPQVKFLVEKEVPSIHTAVKLASGKIFRLYGLHPEPPVPQENPRSTERDAEILMVGKEAKKSKIPVIVAGDLNDVAWSYTTELFLKVSGLLDPRRGRGFYSTFHSKYRLLRWPLDHVFCSSHFSLMDLKRLPDVGSDHFPILISIQLSDEQVVEQNKEELNATKHEEEVAAEKIQRG